MEEGSLKAEYRTSSGGERTSPIGPYYKHQVWQNGRNVSRRISSRKPQACKPPLLIANALRHWPRNSST